MSGHTFDSRHVTTRKAHQCHGCCREFGPGSRLLVCEGVYGGYWWRVRYCDPCEKIVEIEQEMGEDEFEFGFVRNIAPTPEEALEQVREIRVNIARREADRGLHGRAWRVGQIFADLPPSDELPNLGF